jgi:peptide chain release factor subunit 1
MLTRDDVRELAQFSLKDPKSCVSTFYFQPRTPQDRSHREEAIQAKDLVRNAMREAEKNGKNGCARRDLDRILGLAEALHGNQARAKAVFVCGDQNFWREFDLPPVLSGTEVFVGNRFNLKPLALLLGAQPKVAVVNVTRDRGCFFDFRLDELKERGEITHPVSRRGKSDGFGGYDAGHAERHVADEVARHFKDIAQRLQDEAEKGVYDQLILGCRDTQWHEFEPHLHAYVKQRLIGRFSDTATSNPEHVRAEASRILREHIEQRRVKLVKEVLDQAMSNSRGVTGLRRVLRSLELGEVQTLLLSANYKAHASECTNCGHLDTHNLQQCPVCSHAMRELEDVSEALIPAAIKRDIELFYVQDVPSFDQAGNIGALLRFRVDQSKGLPMIA